MKDLKLKSGKKEPKTYINQSPLESLLEIGKGVKKSMVDDLAKNGVYDAWDQILRPTQEHGDKKGGELHPGQELDFSHAKEVVAEVTTMGHEFISEVVNAGRNANKELNHELQVKYNEILIELKALAQSSKELKAEVITVEQTPEVGAYHVNFLEQLLLKLREARENVDDGLAWFKALRSKKSARQYGAMAKSGGTSFTLSNERTAATQSG